MSIKKCVITQREVGTDTLEYKNTLKNTLRQAPDVILIGEIRDEESATLALRSSIDGRVVISTMHASGVYEAVQRLISMAASQMGKEEARALIASGLKAVVHQTIINNVLCVKPLLATDTVKGILMNNEIPLSNLINEAKQQSQFVQRNIPIFK
jgi:Tfp pilus assembly pilus retraction ATPase PilT